MSSRPTAAARGAPTSASRRSPARTCARTSPPTKPIAQARLYVTALGLYEVRINGRKVGEDVLAPGWTEYTKRVPSQTYDVTDLVTERRERDRRDPRRGLVRRPPAGRAQVGHEPRAARPAQASPTPTGRRTRITTDGSWQAGRGGVQRGQHLRRRDLRRPPRPARLGPPRLHPGWPNATERTETMAVEPAQAPPIRVLSHAQAQDPHAAQARHLHLRPRPEPRRLGEADRPGRARAPRSSCASARSSTRTARSTPPTCAPRCRPTPTRSRATAPRPTSRASPTTASATSRSPASPAPRRSTRSKAARSAPHCPRYGTFTSSNPLVNSIQSAIRWGQSSNFLAVPTDASQRDERLGWTGDIQAFASTGAFNGDTQNYLDQWLQTLRDSQSANGAFPDVAPVDLLRRGHRGLGRRGHGRAVGALPPLRRHPHAAAQLRRDEALDRLPAGRTRPA